MRALFSLKAGAGYIEVHTGVHSFSTLDCVSYGGDRDRSPRAYRWLGREHATHAQLTRAKRSRFILRLRLRLSELKLAARVQQPRVPGYVAPARLRPPSTCQPRRPGWFSAQALDRLRFRLIADVEIATRRVWASQFITPAYTRPSSPAPESVNAAQRQGGFHNLVSDCF